MLKLLLIEDDLAIQTMLVNFFEGKQYDISAVTTGKGAIDLLHKKLADIIVLDWMLPDTDGLQWLKYIREEPLFKEIPVLMLTAKCTEKDKIDGLNTGADDYMTKPVSLKELDARIKALLRRSQGINKDNIIIRGPLKLNLAAMSVALISNEQVIKMSINEIKLLHVLMKKKERIYSRTELLDQVWGLNNFIDERTVDVHILRLRKALKPYKMDYLVQTVRGAGYLFSD